MAEIILGTGHQKSVRNVAAIIEKQLRLVEGHPRKITAWSDRTKFVAERKEFSGEWEKYELRVHAKNAVAESLKNVAAGLGPMCGLAEENGYMILTCPADPQGDAAGTAAAVDRLCACLELPEVWRAEGDNYRVEPINVELVFQAMVQYNASDVHFFPGERPIFRIDNRTRQSEVIESVSAVQIAALIRQISSDANWDEFIEHKQTSFNYHQAGIGYARVSAFRKFGAPHCTMRYLPEEIPSFEDLHIPGKTMKELAGLHRGLLLVTGMTGSGKTTTVAALVDWINSHKPLHILTIENPVEYVHVNKKSIISQRNLGQDVETFNQAVTGALRHDPDVIVIGEMRDSDTIRSAINAAATGHLVISTLHSNTAAEVVNRIISFFDPVERDLVKLQLRDCLQCVICQRLVPKKGGGRVPALEIMFNDIKPIRDAVIDGDTDGIRIGIQQTISHSFLFEVYLHSLYKEGTIDLEQGQEYATDQSIFDQMTMGTYSIPRVESLKAARDESQRAKAK